jgi:hypothetical protein
MLLQALLSLPVAQLLEGVMQEVQRTLMESCRAVVKALSSVQVRPAYQCV